MLELSIMDTENPLKKYQKKLDGDSDMKSEYITALGESNSDYSDSDSDSGAARDNFKVIIPKSRGKSRDKYRDRYREEIFAQLIKCQNVLSKTKRKVYKLEADADKEEIISRYIKLDLNNAQVENTELKEKLSQTKLKLTRARVENWVHRVISMMLCVWFLYSLF